MSISSMYLSIVVLGALHGFLFLPVLLSYVGKLFYAQIDSWFLQNILGPVDKVGVRKRRSHQSERTASSEDESLPSNRDDQS